MGMVPNSIPDKCQEREFIHAPKGMAPSSIPDRCQEGNLTKTITGSFYIPQNGPLRPTSLILLIRDIILSEQYFTLEEN